MPWHGRKFGVYALKMVSYAELAAEPLPQIWQELRALRSQKVGAAKSGDRRATFDAALEQAEQLFAAAARVGTATQPILLFYGLSQMGRAIAAASPFLSQKEYSLSGHGLSDGELHGAAAQGLASLKIQCEAKGAFPAVAKALEASSIEEPIPLGDLWDLLPYADRFPLPVRGKLQRLVLDPESTDFALGQEAARGRLYPLPVGLQTTVRDPTQSRTIVDGESVAEEYGLLGRFLEVYPTLSGWRTTSTPGQPIPYQRGFYGHEEYLVLPLILPKSAEQTESSALATRSVSYHGEQYVYPRLDSSGLPAHPFMLWWAVLYPLSRLARYYPNVWAKLTSISSDVHAAPVEFILRESLRAVPELGLRAIKRFA